MKKVTSLIGVFLLVFGFTTGVMVSVTSAAQPPEMCFFLGNCWLQYSLNYHTLCHEPTPYVIWEIGSLAGSQSECTTLCKKFYGCWSGI